MKKKIKIERKIMVGLSLVKLVILKKKARTYWILLCKKVRDKYGESKLNNMTEGC